MKSNRSWSKSGKRRFRFTDIAVAIVVIGVAAFLSWPENKVPLPNDGTDNILTGKPRIADGDSLVISGTKVRLIDIDAPELHQLCGPKESRYECGVRAKAHLGSLIANQLVVCTWQTKDKFHRILARCKAGEIDLNKQMVEDGWAVSYHGYPVQETLALRERRGLWASPFQRPRDWRRSHPR